MTPKEKSDELVDKYYKWVNQIEGSYSELEYAKQCALIAVDEIIEALDCKQWQNKSMIDWYNQVKQEIEKL